MNKKNSPQEIEENFNNGFNSLEYKLNEAGEFVKVTAKKFEPKNIALQQVWDAINEQIDATRKKVQAKELSPLAYYMDKDQMTIKRISYMTGIPKRKIKRHLNPEVFENLKPEILSLYASIFNISMDQLLHLTES